MSVYDIAWLFFTYKDWSRQDVKDGILWNKLQRMHVTCLLFTFIGVIVKGFAIYGLVMAKDEVAVIEHQAFNSSERVQIEL